MDLDAHEHFCTICRRHWQHKDEGCHPENHWQVMTCPECLRKMRDLDVEDDLKKV